MSNTHDNSTNHRSGGAAMPEPGDDAKAPSAESLVAARRTMGGQRVRLIEQVDRPGRMLLAALLIFTALNTTLWALAVPSGEGRNEQNHMNVVNWIAGNGNTPEVDETPGFDVTAAALRGKQVGVPTVAAEPGLAHFVAGVIVALPPDSQWIDYRQARFAGAIWGMLTVLLTFRFVRRFAPENRPVAYSSAGMVAIWPQLTYINGTVNLDGLAAMAGVGLMGSLWAAHRADWTLKHTIGVGIFGGLVLLSPQNTHLLLPFALLFVLISPVAANPAFRIGRAMFATFTSVLVALPWYVDAAIKYGSDVFARDRIADAMTRSGLVAPGAKNLGIDLGTMLSPGSTFSSRLLESFIGLFGALNFHMPGISLATVFVIGGVACTGFITRLIEKRIMRRPFVGWHHLTLTCLTFAPIIVLVAAAFRHGWLYDFEIQGSYLMPIIAPAIVAIAFGISWASGTLWRGALWGGLAVVALGIINVTALESSIMHHYNSGFAVWLRHWQAAIVFCWATSLAVLLFHGFRLVIAQIQRPDA